MRFLLVILFAAGLTTACAGDTRDVVVPVTAAYDSPIPGTIGVAAVNQDGAVVVAGVRADSAAARADVRKGDRIRACNGAPVANARDFERRVLDSRPGSILELDLMRGDKSRSVALPVEEIPTAVQA